MKWINKTMNQILKVLVMQAVKWDQGYHFNPQDQCLNKKRKITMKMQVRVSMIMVIHKILIAFLKAYLVKTKKL